MTAQEERLHNIQQELYRLLGQVAIGDESVIDMVDKFIVTDNLELLARYHHLVDDPSVLLAIYQYLKSKEDEPLDSTPW